MTMAGGPVAIGGIGGSGTRVVAALLQRLGHHIGSDLNQALDNLWFTLLFKRRDILLETSRDLAWLCEQFWLRMSGVPALDATSVDRIARLAATGRAQHDAAWLGQRLQSWQDAPPRAGGPWGWKEPNSHILIDRMFDLRPDLRYIHVLRNPLDMALSRNQNQLNLWGPVLLDRPITAGPRDSLSYGCAVARRIRRILDDHPGRVCLIDFEQLCSDPQVAARQVADFVGAPLDEACLRWFSDLVAHGAPAIGRHKCIPPDIFAPDDLHFVTTLGYVTE
ncbi:sulfotransferase [Sphingobium sp.]|uniref:sulfotransferase n=1 Tax=Sphingobium sp. TaxID=1912891 RepID=UPI002B98A371|nr:sulfotransferase [Sphingobium sp.]HUD90836.1 sulfotransferase [Sphingobium sp.]